MTEKISDLALAYAESCNPPTRAQFEGLAVDCDLKLIGGRSIEEIRETRFESFDERLDDGFYEYKAHAIGTMWLELSILEYQHAVAARDDGIETYILLIRRLPEYQYEILGRVAFSKLCFGSSDFFSPVKIDDVWLEIRGFFCSLNRAIELMERE